MYLQYRSKNGEIYSLDLFEHPSHYLLWVFYWVPAKRMHLTKGVYKKKKRFKSNGYNISLMMTVIIILTKLIEHYSITVLFRANLLTSSILSLLNMGLVLFISIRYLKKTRKDELSQVEISNDKTIIVHFKIKGIFRWLYFLFLAYFCLGVLINFPTLLIAPTIREIIGSMGACVCLILAPSFGLLFGVPFVNGEKLERIQL